MFDTLNILELACKSQSQNHFTLTHSEPKLLKKSRGEENHFEHFVS